MAAPPGFGVRNPVRKVGGRLRLNVITWRVKQATETITENR